MIQTASRQTRRDRAHDIAQGVVERTSESEPWPITGSPSEAQTQGRVSQPRSGHANLLPTRSSVRPKTRVVGHGGSFRASYLCTSVSLSPVHHASAHTHTADRLTLLQLPIAWIFLPLSSVPVSVIRSVYVVGCRRYLMVAEHFLLPLSGSLLTRISISSATSYSAGQT